MIESEFSKFKCLIVEDSEMTRQFLRTTVSNCGIPKIDLAPDFYSALNAIKKTKYDIVLCDYMLSDNRDGQQLLEEVRKKKLLPKSSVWIMITAEQTYQQVFSAAELIPDDYLIKPFSSNVLIERLEKTISKAKFLKPITDLLDKGKHEEATLKAYALIADSLVKKNTKYITDVYQLIGDILTFNNRYEEAITHYTETSKKFPTSAWPRLGLARSFFHMKNYEVAEKLVEELIKEFPNYVKALDLFTRIKDTKGEYEEAKNILSVLLLKNPKAIHRTQHMIQLALDTEDKETAIKAYETMHHYSRGSSLLRQGDFMGYAVLLMGLPDKKTASVKLEDLNNKLTCFFQNDNNFNLAKEHVSFANHTIRNKERERIDSYNKMKELINKTNVSSNENLAILDAAIKMNDEELISILTPKLFKDLSSNEQKIKHLKSMLPKNVSENYDKVIQTTISSLMNEAILLAKNGKIDESTHEFIELANKYPQNSTIVYNATVAIIKKLQKNGYDQWLLWNLKKNYNILKNNKNHKFEEKLIILEKMIEQISSSPKK